MIKTFSPTRSIPPHSSTPNCFPLTPTICTDPPPQQTPSSNPSISRYSFHSRHPPDTPSIFWSGWFCWGGFWYAWWIWYRNRRWFFPLLFCDKWIIVFEGRVRARVWVREGVLFLVEGVECSNGVGRGGEAELVTFEDSQIHMYYLNIVQSLCDQF